MSRLLVLMTSVEEDVIRHGPTMPDVPGPEDLEAGPLLAFPGAEIRRDGDTLATCDQLLIHVSLETRRASDPPSEMAAAIARLVP